MVKKNVFDIETLIFGFILLVLLFKVIANLLPEAQTAGNEVNATSAPLASLFAGDGVVFILIMGAVVLGLVRHYMGKKK